MPEKSDRCCIWGCGATHLPSEGDPHHLSLCAPCPRLQTGLFWRWSIISLRQLWLSTSNSVQSQQAQGWQAAVEKQGGRSGWGGEGTRGGQAWRPLVWTGRQPCDHLLRSCSGHHAAQLPGGRLTRLFSPTSVCPPRDQAKSLFKGKRHL